MQNGTGPVSDVVNKSIRGDLVDTAALLETVQVELAQAGPAADRENEVADYTLSTFPGYAALAAVTPIEGQGDDGQVLLTAPFAFAATTPTEPFETVTHILLLDSNGDLLGAVELPVPILVDQPGEVIQGTILWNMTDNNVEATVTIP